jgi:hypothetical protein
MAKQRRTYKDSQGNIYDVANKRKLNARQKQALKATGAKRTTARKADRAWKKHW